MDIQVSMKEIEVGEVIPIPDIPESVLWGLQARDVIRTLDGSYRMLVRKCIEFEVVGETTIRTNVTLLVGWKTNSTGSV